MSSLVDEAFRQITKLPQDEQERLAQMILDEIHSERHWDEQFANSAESLEGLAEAALVEHRSRKTRPLDPDTL